MKKLLYLLAIAALPCTAFAQDAATLVAEGKRAEMLLKDSLALAKYEGALQLQPTNIEATIKCSELNTAMGARQATPEAKAPFYAKAKTYADAALKLDSLNADANYVTAVVFDKMAEIEKKNDKAAEYIRNTKLFADKALTINANHGKSWNMLGKWHYNLLSMNPVKKAALKVLYGGLPKSDIELCIADFEKSKTLEPYFCQNYLDLAKAYYFNKEYEKSLATLQQCTKCPSRRQDDPAIKQEAKDLLVKWQ